MKNYEDMSDREVNLTVAKLTNDDGDVTRASGKVFVHEYVNSDKSNGLCIGWKEFDPCNNPEDAWPIIDENNITIINDHPSMRLAVNDVSGYYNGFSGIIASFDENGFRAAMIVFLKMNEDKL